MRLAYVIRLAKPGDLESVVDILHERVAWLRALGSDQWSASAKFEARLAKSIARHETWVLFPIPDANSAGGQPSAIGTITIHCHGSARFWTEAEIADNSALYVSKMATLVTHRGQGLGALLLAWARDRAVAQGKTVVRWDA